MMRACLFQSRYCLWHRTVCAALLCLFHHSVCFSQMQPFNIPSQFADLPIGTTPELIIEAYGSPMIKVDIPNSNEEIWSYPDKNIVMENNVVKLFDRSPDHRFQDGSTRLELILAQGFPDKIFYLDGLQQEIWHYQTSLVILKNDTVIEWIDHEGILNLFEPDRSGISALTIGQSKEKIVEIVGNPHSIQQFPALDEAIWHYEGNYLTFKNGKLHSFDQQQKDAESFRGIFKNDGNPETTDTLLQIAANLGILPSTGEILSSSPSQPIETEFRGVFKNDGNAHTNENINNLKQSVVDSNEEWVEQHERVIPQKIVKHFFGLQFTQERTSPLSDTLNVSQPQIKATTNVQQVFGLNFYR